MCLDGFNVGEMSDNVVCIGFIHGTLSEARLSGMDNNAFDHKSSLDTGDHAFAQVIVEIF